MYVYICEFLIIRTRNGLIIGYVNLSVISKLDNFTALQKCITLLDLGSGTFMKYLTRNIQFLISSVSNMLIRHVTYVYASGVQNKVANTKEK
jgi:hypothetical protein